MAEIHYRNLVKAGKPVMNVILVTFVNVIIMMAGGKYTMR